MNSETKEVARLIERAWGAVAPILKGHPPEHQGAALADLVATWLAGHVVEGDPAATAQLREEFLQLHIKTVRKLIPENAKMLGVE